MELKGGFIDLTKILGKYYLLTIDEMAILRNLAQSADTDGSDFPNNYWMESLKTGQWLMLISGATSNSQAIQFAVRIYFKVIAWRQL